MSRKADILELLKRELDLLERGGYRSAGRTPWRAPLVFEDSPTCLNYGQAAGTSPCSQCPLMNFVPLRHQHTPAPCRYIRLNQQGETLEGLYRYATQKETEKTVGQWLRGTIRALECDPVLRQRLNATAWSWVATLRPEEPAASGVNK